jgi:hypothetical protein
MHRSRKSANPFYVLLIVIGVVFALTATAYGVMVYRASAPPKTADEAAAPPAAHLLMDWMRNYGDAALVVELSLLAICTVGAIGTDEYWQRRATQDRNPR